jgi:hypothetical protein
MGVRVMFDTQITSIFSGGREYELGAAGHAGWERLPTAIAKKTFVIIL